MNDIKEQLIECAALLKRFGLLTPMQYGKIHEKIRRMKS